MTPLVPMKPLDGPGGYLRWKESVLLRLHTLGVARVLSVDRPFAAGDEATAKNWDHDDAICRGHILTTLSDRLLPDYARIATAGDLWRALARTYDVDSRRAWRDRFDGFEFHHKAPGDVLLEEMAHAEALGVAAKLPDDHVASALCGKLPEVVGTAAVARPDAEIGMSVVWDVARRVVASDIGPEWLWKTPETDDEEQGGYYLDGPKPPGQSTGRRERGEHGHVARNCRRRGFVRA
ncbi:hypothetical protein HU200_007108 [Digitaria exilis]|uniref:Uncharacterized protein n=1 Tax=Digitaria exilis TaxID=1010633 RepID=A0A835KST9_9POAL|nr:hypothetical protein HU200_007108 [Digitaria exilis]